MSERNMRKTTVGKVVSNKMDKTIVVAVEDSYRHPLYNKIIKRTVKRKAHDEENVCGIGDRVRIMETRPLSKDKNPSFGIYYSKRKNNFCSKIMEQENVVI